MAVEADEDGNHDFDFDLILNERVISVLQQIRYTQGMKVADAGMLRKVIVQRFVDEPEEGQSETEAVAKGTDISHALILWYFETVDPEAAPIEEEVTAGDLKEEIVTKKEMQAMDARFMKAISELKKS